MQPQIEKNFSVRAASQTTKRANRASHADHVWSNSSHAWSTKTKGLCILFDSRSTQTHEKRSFVTRLHLRNESDATKSMATAQIKTRERYVVHSSLPKFSPMRTVAQYMHNGSLNIVHYGMVMETDLLERLKLNVKYSTSPIEW